MCGSKHNFKCINSTFTILSTLFSLNSLSLTNIYMPSWHMPSYLLTKCGRIKLTLWAAIRHRLPQPRAKSSIKNFQCTMSWLQDFQIIDQWLAEVWNRCNAYDQCLPLSLFIHDGFHSTEYKRLVVTRFLFSRAYDFLARWLIAADYQSRRSAWLHGMAVVMVHQPNSLSAN